MANPSFLFIVNELPTNDDPEVMDSVPPRHINLRWHPPVVARGFLPPVPGDIYRWDNGTISIAEDYYWYAQETGEPVYASGRIVPYDTNTREPEYYRAATVFYCNRFDKFFTAQGDVRTRDIYRCAPDDGWLPLIFTHNNNITYVEHMGDQDHTAVREASWIGSLLPTTYRRGRNQTGPAHGSLSGTISIIVALVAFSCSTQDLRYVLLNHQAWRGYRWVPHNMQSGSESSLSISGKVLELNIDTGEPGRGLTATVFTDPRNPEGSTLEAIQNLEQGIPIPIFR